MWLPDETRVVKIRIHNQGKDAETLWAQDLGPTETDPWNRYVRLSNVPILHAKPTYGDVIEVQPSPSGWLEWDRYGVAPEDLDTRIHEDGGRWLMIVDYWPVRPGEDVRAAFKALDAACESAGIVAEGAFTDEEKGRGTACLAVPDSKSPAEVVHWLGTPELGVKVTVIHPRPHSRRGAAPSVR